MPRQLTCRQGHRWEVDEERAPPPGLALTCPVCGIGAFRSSAGEEVARTEPPTLAPGQTRPATPDSDGATVTCSPGPREKSPAEAAAPGADGSAVTQGTPGRPAVPGYEILEELGRGGMGVVYRARQVKADRLVALKMILAGGHAGAEALTRFRREAEAVARLQHPNVVQVYEVGEADGLPFFSLELVAGGSLDKKLQGRPLPAREAAALVERVARGVEAAHQQGVLHRDLKPANVLLAADGTPKVTDFGLAKRLQGQPGVSAPGVQTASGAILGTPSYMPPEQALGQLKKVGPASDVYSLGAVLYELLTGRPPFVGADLIDTLFQVATEEPVPPSRLNASTPRDLETICLKCLAKEPKKRYAGALELAEDLRRYPAGEPIHARPVGTWERGLKWVKRRSAPGSAA
jgi:serine/threonine protein kinase